MFYDPIGQISSMILQTRLIFHKICTGKCAWDTELPSNLVNLWNRLIKKLNALERVPVSYVLCKCGNKNKDVYGFCYGSGEAYNACIYILILCYHGVTVNLDAIKCRLVPPKSRTIPRLELLSCLLLSKLLFSSVEVIGKVVTVSSIFCWSDRMVALWWIKQVEKHRNTWVQNMVNVIRANSSTDIWFHIPSSSNAADISTRSISLAHLDLLNSFHGPHFLLDNPKNWSPKEVTLPFGEINLEERSINIVVATVCSAEQEALDKVIDCHRYGSLMKLFQIWFINQIINGC